MGTWAWPAVPQSINSVVLWTSNISSTWGLVVGKTSIQAQSQSSEGERTFWTRQAQACENYCSEDLGGQFRSSGL